MSHLVTDFRNARRGDLLKFPSGLVRKIMSITPGKYVSFIQLRDGLIGNYRSPLTRPHRKKRTHANGKRRTTYTWSDLRRIWRKST